MQELIDMFNNRLDLYDNEVTILEENENLDPSIRRKLIREALNSAVSLRLGLFQLRDYVDALLFADMTDATNVRKIASMFKDYLKSTDILQSIAKEHDQESWPKVEAEATAVRNLVQGVGL